MFLVVLGSDIAESAGHWWQQTIDFLPKLNLFPSIPPSTNEFDLRNERISTRLFIVLLILLLSILLGYTSLTHVIKTKDVSVPTLSQYVYLYSKYPQTLTCPCTKISIEYGRFLRVKYTLHQVCSSIFVEKDFITDLFTRPRNQTIQAGDFRAIGEVIFYTLDSLCQLMDKILYSGIIRFYSNQRISAIVIPEQLFRLETQTSFEQFVSLTINQFLLSMQIIRDTTQANALFSGRLTNYYFDALLLDDLPGLAVFQPYAIELANCSCASSPSCIDRAAIYDGEDLGSVLFFVPGFYRGCFMIDGLLQSTLECLYNQTCLDVLLSFMKPPSVRNVTSLDASSSGRYNKNSTMQELINELMVENWNSSITYKDYYEECQPAQCSYTYVTRNDAIYIVTTIFGLVGGLVTVLRFSIPRSVRCIARFVRKYKNRRIDPLLSLVQS